MRNRVPQKTLIATAGAVLLSGSVFAAGPTIDGIGTVVISDQMPQAEVEANPTTPFDWMTDVTRNVYRFDNAFALSDYVNSGSNSSTDLEATKYIFKEWVDDGSKALVPVADGSQTIQINGEVGDQSISDPATKADFDFATNPDVLNAGELDFLNIYRTGPDPDNPTNPSGIDGPFSDTAYVSMYVGREDADDVDGDIITVVTTNEAQFDPAAGAEVRYDFHSDAGGILTCLMVNDDMSGWLFVYRGQSGTQGCVLGDYLTNPQSTWGGAYTNPPDLPGTPGVTLQEIDPDPGFSYNRTADGTEFLTLQTDGTPDNLVIPDSASDIARALFGPQYGGFQNYRVDLDFTYGNAVPADQIVAGTAYMARFHVSSLDSTAAQRRPNTRFRLGDTTTNGIGNTSDEWLDGSNSHLGDNESRVHRAYFYAHVDGSGYGEEYNDRVLNVNFDSIDVFNDTMNDDSTIRLDKVEILSFDPADLGEGTVLLNHGGEVGTDFELAAGQPAPPATDYADFGNSVWRPKNVEADFGVTDRPIAFVPAGVDLPTNPVPAGTKALMINYGPSLDQSNVAKWTLRTTDPAAIPPGLVDIPNENLVVLDVWLSSTDGATPDNSLAWTRISLLDADPAGAGRGSLFSFNADNATADNIEENGKLIPAPLALETGAKMYRVIIEPQSATGTSTLIPAVEAIIYDNLELPVDWKAWPPEGSGTWFSLMQEGNLTINRVVMTSYPVPPEFVNGSCD